VIAYFPYVRVTQLREPGIPPQLMIELEGFHDANNITDELVRTGFLHSDLPASWLLPAVVAGLDTVGISVPGEFVNRGGSWLAWIDLDLCRSAPDISAIAFGEHVGFSNA
jgi:hypothetical protein